MKRLWMRIGVAVIGLLVALVLARNVIARKTVELGFRRTTGFPLEIGAVNVGLFNGQLEVRDLKLMNPPEFGAGLFVDLTRFHLDYRLGSMLRGAPHINAMTVDLHQMVIVKDATGNSNVTRLQGITSSGTSSNRTKYRVDLLKVRVGTVTIKDASRGKPTERAIPLNITATYKDITDATDINRLVLLTVLNQARVPEMGIKSVDLKKGLTSATAVAGEILKGTTNVVGATTKGLADTLKKAIPQK